MKKYNFLIITILLYLNTYSQQLSIKETIEYIENIENVYQGYIKDNEKVNVKYDLSNEGIFSKQTYYVKNGKIRYDNRGIISVHVDDLKRDFVYDGNAFIKFQCKSNNCIRFGSRYGNDYLHVFIEQEYDAKKIIKALKYLFSLIDEINYNRDIDDPFAPKRSNEMVILNKKSNQSEIKLKDNGGVFYIPVSIGTLNKYFVLDSGASEITISSTLENELLKYGLINKKVKLPDALYRIADGKVINQRRVLITKLSVGSFSINNIVASIGSEDSPFLLGKNFLDKFKSWSINNARSTLILSN